MGVGAKETRESPVMEPPPAHGSRSEGRDNVEFVHEEALKELAGQGAWERSGGGEGARVGPGGSMGPWKAWATSTWLCPVAPDSSSLLSWETILIAS